MTRNQKHLVTFLVATALMLVFLTLIFDRPFVRDLLVAVPAGLVLAFITRNMSRRSAPTP